MRNSLVDLKKIAFNIDKNDHEKNNEKVSENLFLNELQTFFKEYLSIDNALQESLIYYNLPFWWILSDDKIERWIKDYPILYSSNEREKQYQKLYDSVVNSETRLVNFTITEFACINFKKIPEYIQIEFIDSDDAEIIFKQEDKNGLLQYNFEFRYPNINVNTFTIEALINTINELPANTVIPGIFNNTQNQSSNSNKDTYLNFFKFLVINKYIFQDIKKIMFLLSKIIVEKDGSEKSFGGIIFALNNVKNLNNNTDIWDNYWLKINIKFREWAIWQWSVKQKRELIFHSMRSAVAAIMGRNMSHNIGSHVLSNLKNETREIAERISDNNNQLLQTLNFGKDFFYGISWFTNYLQERQDYIATITGFENQTFIPVNFKTFILDGFLPDHHYLRHINDESIKNYKNLLLEHIATSENLKRENIKTYFRDFETSERTFVNQKSFELICELNVSLPGGILGRQAFFSIMENLIRNAAKHSMNNSFVDLKIFIDCPHLDYDSENKTVILKKNDTSIYPNSEGKFKIQDKDYLFITNDNNFFLKSETDIKDFHKLTFDDNDKLFYFTLSGKKIYVYEYDPHEFILFTLTDNLKSYTAAESSLNKALKDPLIDNQTGTLNPMYKGLKEMRISALWIRGLMITDLEKKQFPPILQIKPSTDDGETENSIKYSFFLLKPKELLIVLTQEHLKKIIKNNESKVNKLRNSGVEFICTEDINKGSNFRHSLFVIDSSINEYDKSKFNQRITTLEYDFIIDALKYINLDSEKGRRQFIAKFWGKRQKEHLNIFISDDAEVCNDGGNYFKKITEYNTADNCKILFKKHNDTKSEFLAFKESNTAFFNSLVFLEGISGGNSTHLYMRKLIKDNLLYLRLLESCLTKVLIIDERIWNNNLKYSINQIGLQVLDDERINNFINQNHNKTQTDWIINFINEFNVNQVDYNDLYSHRDELDIIKNSLLRTGAYLQPAMVNSPDDDYSFHFYHKKNIQLMNILYKEEGSEKSFHFYNLKKEMYYKLLQRNNNIEFTEIVNGNSFDIICIHQGIIDKIHEKFHVEFLNIFEKFSHLFPKAIKIVHSGRSKPASEIPEGYNFLPYSSLENAFNDCKFSLTEVLYNVKKDL